MSLYVLIASDALLQGGGYHSARRKPAFTGDSLYLLGGQVGHVVRHTLG